MRLLRSEEKFLKQTLILDFEVYHFSNHSNLMPFDLPITKHSAYNVHTIFLFSEHYAQNSKVIQKEYFSVWK